jgi:hypothetical protein
MNPEGTSASASQALLADPGNVLKPLTADERSARPVEAARRRAETFRASGLWKAFVGDRIEVRARGSRGGAAGHRAASFTRQARILASRCLTLRLKDRVNALVVLGQAPAIGMFVWLIFREAGGDSLDLLRFFDTVPRVLFLLVVASVWFGCSNAVREIVGERSIYRRERMVNLRIGSYLAAKLSVLTLIALVQSLTLLLPVWIGFGLQGMLSFFLLWLVLWLSALASTSLGLAISAAFRSPEAAVSMLPLVLIPQVLAAGSIFPVSSMTPLARGVAGLTLTRWGYESLMRGVYSQSNPDAILHACYAATEAEVRVADPSKLPFRDTQLRWGCLQGRPALCESAIREPSLRAATCAATDGSEDPSARLELERTGIETGTARARRHAICGQVCPSVDLDLPLAPLETVYGVSGSPLRDVERKSAESRGRGDVPPARPRLETQAAPQMALANLSLGLWFVLYLMLTAVLLKRNDADGLRK